MGLLFDGCINFIQAVVFSKGDNIGITSSTCRHCTLNNFIMCSDFIPHPYLVSFLFIPSLYSLLFNSKNFSFSSFLPFFTAYMHVQSPGVQCNVDLAPKIGLSIWTKLDGYSYSYLPCYYAKVSPLHSVL